MKGKTVLITGATSGIGKETSRKLIRMGAHVIFIARDKYKAQQLINEINIENPGARVDYIIADLSSLSQVKEAARTFLSNNNRLDILINNAGGYFNPRNVTPDGYEYTFAVNYLSHFLLTNLLTDILIKSSPSRIVNLSSVVHFIGRIYFHDLMLEKHYNGMKAYAQSKLANLIFSNELSRRLSGTGVTSNAVHPGVVNTDFSKNLSGLFGKLFSVASFLFKTPEEGARTSIYVSSAAELEGITGKYFVNCKPAKPKKETNNPEIARKLWDISDELTRKYT